MIEVLFVLAMLAVLAVFVNLPDPGARERARWYKEWERRGERERLARNIDRLERELGLKEPKGRWLQAREIEGMDGETYRIHQWVEEQ